MLTHANVSNDIEGIVMEVTTNVAATTGTYQRRARPMGPFRNRIVRGDQAQRIRAASPPAP